MLVRNLVLKTAAIGPVEKTVRGSKLFRPLVRRFIAGDTLEEALAASEALLKNGLMVTLDYLGENTRSEAEALAAKTTYLRMLDRIAEADSPAIGPVESLNISIKLTQCGLDQGEAFAEANYREVVARAAERNGFVRIDMEASDYTARTVEIVERVFKDLPNTGTVLQSYLYRTDEDIERMIALGARVRLVKGAYLESETVAHVVKAKVDEQFLKQGKRLLQAGHYPALATQDESAIREFNAFAAENGFIEFDLAVVGDHRTGAGENALVLQIDLQKARIGQGKRCHRKPKITMCANCSRAQKHWVRLSSTKPFGSKISSSTKAKRTRSKARPLVLVGNGHLRS